MPSLSEENYLKAIYILNSKDDGAASTNAIAERLTTKASSVTSMLKKLCDKGLVSYKKYKAANLTEQGKQTAIAVIRKHRLWEYFLYKKLKFNWSEVHELAEQLEHIQSPELTNRLDDFLGNPGRDPHGDPIPDQNGNFPPALSLSLSDLEEGEKAVILGVKDHGTSFFNHLKSLEIKLGDECQLLSKVDYDGSVELLFDNNKKVTVSKGVADNLLIKKEK